MLSEKPPSALSSIGHNSRQRMTQEKRHSLHCRISPRPLEDEYSSGPHIRQLYIAAEDIVHRTERAAYCPPFLPYPGISRNNLDTGFIHPPDLSVVIHMVIASVHNAVLYVSVFLYILNLREIISAFCGNGAPQFDRDMSLPRHAPDSFSETFKTFICVGLRLFPRKYGTAVPGPYSS